MPGPQLPDASHGGGGGQHIIGSADGSQPHCIGSAMQGSWHVFGSVGSMHGGGGVAQSGCVIGSHPGALQLPFASQHTPVAGSHITWQLGSVIGSHIGGGHISPVDGSQSGGGGGQQFGSLIGSHPGMQLPFASQHMPVAGSHIGGG